jgi:hypothetical protein
MTKNTAIRLTLVLQTYGARPKGIAWILNAMKPGVIEAIIAKNKRSQEKKEKKRVEK